MMRLAAASTSTATTITHSRAPVAVRMLLAEWL